MALRKIVKLGDDILIKKCKTVTSFDEKLGMILDDMAQTMYDSDGVGLAGPQVGLLRRICVIDIGEGLLEFVNPVIKKTSGKQRDVEGCLSCPNQWGYVVRPKNVTVEYFDRNGKPETLKCSDFLARAVCHEVDHLDGNLFIDIADEMVRPEDLEK